MPNTSKEVDTYIAKSPEFARPILTKIRAAFHEGCPDLEEKIKWSVPSFEYKGMMGGMSAFKHYVTFGFWKQAIMKDPDGIFEKDRPMASGRLTSVADLPPNKVLVAYVKEAAVLNDKGVKVPQPPRAKVAAKLRVPADLAKALKQNATANATFTSFNNSQQNEYVEWITDAKQDATRTQRLETTIEWLSQGKPRNWKYMRMK